MRRLCHIAILSVVAIAVVSGHAAPISAERAVELAADWTARERRSSHHMHSIPHTLRPPTGFARTCSLGGTNLFHLVSLDGGGFVTVSADDGQPAVIGFSTSGELPSSDEANPFWAIVGADAAERRAGGRRRHMATRRRNARGARRKFAFSDADTGFRSAARMQKAAKLSSSAPVQSSDGLDDVRVAPLVQSKWDQSTVGGKNVFNYYTPKGYLCGCVATALSQIMRFHRFPRADITPKTLQCYTNEVPLMLTMKGGTYSWDDMPLVPTSSISDIQRRAIGKICFDVGVAARMQYASDGSAAYGGFAHDFLKNIFGFPSAESYGLDSGSIPAELFGAGILANLDAGYPVMLGIYGPSAGGHAVIADGYGYLEGALFCHLNMGWSGSYDYWYAIPYVKSYFVFTELTDIVYNIFPDRAGELVTGRITNMKGEPLAGVTVRATIESGKRPKVTTTTNAVTGANGIYAIFAPAGVSSTITLSIDYCGVSTNSTTTTTASSSLSNPNYDTGSYSLASPLGIGNSWGNDFAIDPFTPFRMMVR